MIVMMKLKIDIKGMNITFVDEVLDDNVDNDSDNEAKNRQ